MSHLFILPVEINVLLSSSGIFSSPRIWDKKDANVLFLSQICSSQRDVPLEMDELQVMILFTSPVMQQ